MKNKNFNINYEILKNSKKHKKKVLSCDFNNCKIRYFNPELKIYKKFNKNNYMLLIYNDLNNFKTSNGSFFKKDNTHYLYPVEENYRFIDKNGENESLKKLNISKKDLETIIEKFKEIKLNNLN